MLPAAKLREVHVQGVEPFPTNARQHLLERRRARQGRDVTRKALHPASLSRIVRRLDLSRQKARPLHPEADERAKAAFTKGGSARR